MTVFQTLIEKRCVFLGLTKFWLFVKQMDHLSFTSYR